MDVSRQRRSHLAFASAAMASVLGLLVAGPAAATVVLDQQQPVFDAAPGSYDLGGDSEQKLAQTVTAGRRGALVQVDLPVVCGEGATLVVKITRLDAAGQPGSRVLSTTRVPASDLFATDPPTFRSIVLSHPPFMGSGDTYAIVIEAEGATCGLYQGSIGETYAGGSGFYDARPALPGWHALDEHRGTPYDLPFKTWVDLPSRATSGFCTIPPVLPHPGGPAPVIVPIPAWVPLCRCLADRGLREARCGLFLPDLFLVRELLPPMQGRPAEIRWTALPLTDHPEVPNILESPPPGAGLQDQTVDFGASLAALKPVSRTITIPTTKGADLEGWSVKYARPEPAQKQQPISKVPRR